ncbi:myb-like protein K [Folsomia candida]|uniref:Uncharacterized protein n=1 Tax=Folsomia candida TaxID=158441 RepID=A0A226F4L4_FOLCA|nr:myb-like protein K [Folsomia candida]OXA64388.1 hypothetical protein Fcan01_01245 [Folsomia candida]
MLFYFVIIAVVGVPICGAQEQQSTVDIPPQITNEMLALIANRPNVQAQQYPYPQQQYQQQYQPQVQPYQPQAQQYQPQFQQYPQPTPGPGVTQDGLTQRPPFSYDIFTRPPLGPIFANLYPNFPGFTGRK